MSALDWVAVGRVVAQGVADKQVEHGAGLAGAGGRVGLLRVEQRLHSAGGELGEGEVLERRQDVETYLVAVVVLGAVGQLLGLQVGVPAVDLGGEWSVGAQVAGVAEPGTAR